MRYIKYNVIVSSVIVLLILQQSRKGKMIENLSIPWGKIKSIAKDIASTVVKNFVNPILGKVTIAVDDLLILVDATFQIITAIAEITIITLQLLVFIIGRANILQEIVLDTNNILGRLVERINIILDIGQNIITLSSVLFNMKKMIFTGNSNIDDWVNIQSECSCALGKLMDNLYKIFTKSFVDLYDDIIDVSALDIFGLLSPKELFSFIKKYKRAIDKIRNNINRMTKVINRSRRSIEKLAKEINKLIPGVDLSFPIDITDLISLSKEGISFMTFSPDIMKKQLRFGKTLADLFKTATRTVSVTGELIKVGKLPGVKIDTPSIDVVKGNLIGNLGLDGKKSKISGSKSKKKKFKCKAKENFVTDDVNNNINSKQKEAEINMKKKNADARKKTKNKVKLYESEIDDTNPYGEEQNFDWKELDMPDIGGLDDVLGVFKELGKKLEEGAKEVYKLSGKALDEIEGQLGEASEKVTEIGIEVVGKSFERVGDVIGSGAKAIGGAASSGVKAIGGAASSVGGAVGGAASSIFGGGGGGGGSGGFGIGGVKKSIKKLKAAKTVKKIAPKKVAKVVKKVAPKKVAKSVTKVVRSIPRPRIKVGGGF